MIESKSSLGQLPHLPLDEHTTHITQDMVDRIFDYLTEHYPERVEKIAQYERGYTDANTIMVYAEAMNPVIKDMSRMMDTPDSELGYIELNFELVRRCRTARRYELPKVMGKPLAPSIEGPYPDRLADKPIFHNAVFESGFTQELIDAWGDEYYQSNKNICFIKAESGRREVASFYLSTRNPIAVYFRKKAEETGNENIIRHYSAATNEFTARISLTCETITLDTLRNLEMGWNNTVAEWKKS